MATKWKDIPRGAIVKIIKRDELNLLGEMTGYDILGLYGVVTSIDRGHFGDTEPLFSVKINGTEDIVMMYGDEIEEINGR